MKESLAKITAWIKAHPIPAAIIGLVVVVVGYFVVKSSGGNSSGESIDGGTLGAEESSPLIGLGGGDMSLGGTTSTGTTPESIPTSTGGVAAYNDISTPSAAESIATYGTPSDYVNESAIFSGPTPAADVFNNVSKMTLADSGFTKSVSSAPTNNKNYGPALVSTNTGQPARPVSGGGVAATLAKVITPSKAPTLASILPAVTKPTPYVAPKPSVNNLLSNALTKPATPKPAATPAFNIFKNIGTVSGYKWDSKLKKYVRTSTAQPMKAY
jgi:hypothetical protein